MNSEKIVGILKICLVISMLLFVIVVTKYKTNDCQLCSFEIEEETFRIGSFMDYYYFKCIDSMQESIIIEQISYNGGDIDE